MTKREKIIATIAVILGATVGTGLGYFIARFAWAYLIVLFLALIGFMTLAAMTVAVVMDTRREDRSYPANWGFDKSFED
jgi:high-affinity Fe2+/Pb2+ permease